jgi:predicted transcriptional regulator
MPKAKKRMSLLLNPIRRRIYEVVCESPGIHFYKIASELATSQGTLDWHLRQLEKDELLNSTKVKKVPKHLRPTGVKPPKKYLAM